MRVPCGTKRGQNMTDARMRDQNAIARDNAKLETGAVKNIAELEGALKQVGELRSVVKENGGWMGPAAGLLTAPLIGRGAQMMGVTQPAKIKARIDLIRQTVGKALEGGVLRKEDEAKYEAILPTMSDKPDVAMSKVDMLEKKLQQDLSTFVGTQSAAGRRVPDVSESMKSGGDSTTVTVNGKNYKFPSGAAAQAFKKEMGVQ